MAEQTHAKKPQRTKIEQARDTAFNKAKSTVQGLEANPVGVLVGGLAVGLIAGAFVPRSEREKAALRPVGKRLAESTVAAVAAAKETGKEHLNASLLSPDTAKQSARAVFDSAVAAVKGSSKREPEGEAQQAG